MERKFIPALVGVAVVLGVLVWAAVGRDHTHTVTVTKTHVVTRTVVKHAPAPKFDGKIQSLVSFLHPGAGRQVPCPKGINAQKANCYGLQGDTFWMVVAVAKP